MVYAGFTAVDSKLRQASLMKPAAKKSGLGSSGAESFFAQVAKRKGRAFEYLSDLATSGLTDENEWREFKDAAWLNLGGESRTYAQRADSGDTKLKAIWSECIGAFANSSGGVLIWGINAPKRVAIGLSLASDAPALAARLAELATDAVDPPVLGVEVRAVVRGPADPAGFVVCYLPASNFAPHSSRWADREYYIRVQDGNRRCPTGVLRRLFYPRSFPRLVPIVRATIDKTGDGFYMSQIQVRIANRGAASAREPYVEINDTLGAARYACDTKQWEASQSSDRSFRGLATIHPDQTVPFLHNIAGNFGQSFPQLAISIRFRLFAIDAPSVVAEVQFEREELELAMINRRFVEREALTAVAAAD